MLVLHEFEFCVFSVDQFLEGDKQNCVAARQCLSFIINKPAVENNKRAVMVRDIVETVTNLVQTTTAPTETTKSVSAYFVTGIAASHETGSSLTSKKHRSSDSPAHTMQHETTSHQFTKEPTQ